MARAAGTEVAQVSDALMGMRIDELISNLAIGIAQGQMALDDACRAIATYMGESQIPFGTRPGTDEPEMHSLIELGFTPNFYQFVDTILEVRVAVSVENTESSTLHTMDVRTDEVASQSSATDNWNNSYSNYGGGYYGYYGWPYGWGYGSSNSTSGGSRSNATQRKTITVNTVDAKYAQTYQYAVEGSSLIKTKLVPIPPPSVLEEMIRDRARLQKIENDQALMRNAAKKILPGVRIAFTALAATDFANSQKAANVTPINQTRTEMFTKKLAALSTELAALGRDHWISMGAESSGAAVATALDALTVGRDYVLAQLEAKETEFAEESKKSLVDAVQVIGDALTLANQKLYPVPAA